MICAENRADTSIEKVLKLIFIYYDNFYHPNNINYMV